MVHIYSHCDTIWGHGVVLSYLRSLCSLCLVPLSYLTLRNIFVGSTRVEALVAIVSDWISGELKSRSGTECSGIIHFMCSAGFFWFSLVLAACIPGVPTMVLREVSVFAFAVRLWGTVRFCFFPRSYNEWVGFFLLEHKKRMWDSWAITLGLFFLFFTELLCIFIRPLTLFLRVWANTLIGQVLLAYCFRACIRCLFLSRIFWKPLGVFYLLLSFFLWFIELCLITIHWGLFLILVITYANDFPMARVNEYQEYFKKGVVESV